MKMNGMMKRQILSLLILLLVAVCAGAKEYRPEDVPNVHLKDRTQYISDPENLMTQKTKTAVNARLRALEDSTTVQMAIAVLPSIGGDDIFDFTQKLASDWGVGHSDKDNGLVVVFDLDGRNIRMHTGQGLEGRLTDVACSRIIDEEVIPNMKEGNLDKAVDDMTARTARVLTDPEAAAEIRSQEGESRSPFSDDNPMLLLFIPIVVTVFCYAWLIVICVRLRGKDDFQKALMLHNSNSTALDIVLCVLSLGLGVPAVLIRKAMLKHYRNHGRKCDLCGTPMKKLDEEQDNLYLTPAQDLEERIRSVDYDVWLCPRCGATEIFPFPEKDSAYTKCPACGTHAMRLLYDRIDVRPTATKKGYGTKVYECMNCHKREERRYEIPAQGAGPIIIAGGGRGGSGGGGFSGGSWGGGSFGGGGSSGSW